MTDVETKGLRAKGGKAKKVVTEVIDQVEDAAHHTLDAAQAVLGQARTKVKDLSEEVPEKIGRAVSTSRDYAIRGSDYVNRQLSDRPLTAVVIAGVVGIGVALFMRRKKADKAEKA